MWAKRLRPGLELVLEMDSERLGDAVGAWGSRVSETQPGDPRLASVRHTQPWAG